MEIYKSLILYKAAGDYYIHHKFYYLIIILICKNEYH